MSKLDYSKGFYDSGELLWEGWKLDGKHHNEEGPAHVSYKRDGGVWLKWWYLNGVNYTEEEWKDLVFRKVFEEQVL